jgi:hypothetical protein
MHLKEKKTTIYHYAHLSSKHIYMFGYIFKHENI